MSDPSTAASASAGQLAKRTGLDSHDIAVVLGSGWAPAADALGSADAEVPLAALGGFPPPTVSGHSPAVRSLRAGDAHVLVFLGRVHLYEGHDPATVVHGVRTAVAAALLFGFSFQLQTELSILRVPVSSFILLMAPYVATIIAVAGLVGRVRPPAADGQPYVKA